jgi:transcriptional regulator with XRE-family HTH domain
LKRGLRLVLADIIKQELERQELTQTELARRIGWSISSVNNVCRARRGGLDLYDDIFTSLQIEIGYRSNAKP